MASHINSFPGFQDSSYLLCRLTATEDTQRTQWHIPEEWQEAIFPHFFSGFGGNKFDAEFWCRSRPKLLKLAMCQPKMETLKMTMREL